MVLRALPTFMPRVSRVKEEPTTLANITAPKVAGTATTVCRAGKGRCDAPEGGHAQGHMHSSNGSFWVPGWVLLLAGGCWVLDACGRRLPEGVDVRTAWPRYGFSAGVSVARFSRSASNPVAPTALPINVAAIVLRAAAGRCGVRCCQQCCCMVHGCLQPAAAAIGRSSLGAWVPPSSNEVGTHCTASAAPNWRYEV
jgi:hypothetical protein